MRSVLYIGRNDCPACVALYNEVVAQLEAKYPASVTSHVSWDVTIARVNGRKEIKHIPLFVVENDGEEEFRFSGRLSAEQIEGIVNYEGETLTLEDVIGQNG